jgi:hypothetical protein
MQWEKYGLVVGLKNLPHWGRNSFLQPTPILLNEETIRVYAGIRDSNGVSRIGYFDLDVKDPRKIFNVSSEPVLEPGQAGAFDDNGVVPSAVLKVDGKIYLYYAGYHLSNQVRFSVLGGLCVSTDQGHTFERVKKVPVFERDDQDLIFRVPHTVILENGLWRFWYGGGDHFITHNDYSYPVYDIRYLESNKPDCIQQKGKIVLPTAQGEYRVARPYVVKISSQNYMMFYCYATLDKGYRLGYAESTDGGLTWLRLDDQIGLDVSNNPNEWDSGMLGYPSFLQTQYGSYLFYNGRNYGADGFGCAKLIIGNHVLN